MEKMENLPFFWALQTETAERQTIIGNYHCLNNWNIDQKLADVRI